jgi:hypothetical protein
MLYLIEGQKKDRLKKGGLIYIKISLYCGNNTSSIT